MSQERSTTETLTEASRALQRLGEIALAEAKSLGADAAKISVSAGLSQRLVVENKQFTLVSSLETRSIGIVVHKDRKKGSASINTTAEAGVRKAVADALALATYSVPDPDLTLATLAEAPKAAALPFLFDQKLAEIDLKALESMMQETLARLVRDPRVALDRYEMAADTTWHALMTSVGVRQEERQTQANWSFFGMARDGDEVTGFDYDGDFAFATEGLLAKSLAGAAQFESKILKGLKPRQAPSYRGAVLLSPRAVQELLLGMVLYHAGGRQVMDGKSRWDKAVGQRVLSPLLTVSDEPHDPLFAGATAFDGDGVPTRAHRIIDQGVLGLHLHDCYSARKCKTKTTGTSGGPFSTRVAAGATPLAELLGSRSRLLLVDRFSGNSDPVKGDFSGVAKASRLIEGGKDVGAVTETMIAGNFFEIAQAVLAVSKEVEMVSGGFRSPYVLVDGVSVTGEG